MDNNKSLRQSGQGKQGQGQDLNPQRKSGPAGSHRKIQPGQQQPASPLNQETGQQAQQRQTAQAENARSSQSSETITNQDQQRQATNAGDSNRPMGEEETEGDRQREEQLKPYITEGNDSAQTEKNSATVK